MQQEVEITTSGRGKASERPSFSRLFRLSALFAWEEEEHGVFWHLPGYAKIWAYTRCVDVLPVALASNLFVYQSFKHSVRQRGSWDAREDQEGGGDGG